MKILRYALLSVLFASVSLANIGQKGREKHHELNKTVQKERVDKAEAVDEAKAAGKTLVQKCPDLVIKNGKRTTVIKCGNPKRANPTCHVCGVKA